MREPPNMSLRQFFIKKGLNTVLLCSVCLAAMLLLLMSHLQKRQMTISRENLQNKELSFLSESLERESGFINII